MGIAIVDDLDVLVVSAVLFGKCETGWLWTSLLTVERQVHRLWWGSQQFLSYCKYCSVRILPQGHI